MHDIALNCRTMDGDDIGVVYLPHAPENADKIARLRESMTRDGWQGRPVILIDAGDHHIAVNGVHRLCAAVDLGIEINAVILDDLTTEQFDLLDQAIDDDDRLAALREIGHTDAITTMAAEKEARQ